MNYKTQEHPFAEFIKILGKGKKGSRPLTQEEAYRAMTMILAKKIEPLQLGAFLMLMRMKEETPEELAGFVLATRNSLMVDKSPIKIDLDWSSYAGKRRHLPWFLLSIFLLAENGIRIFMHGATGYTQNRIYIANALKNLGYNIASSIAESKLQIQQTNFSYLSLEFIFPELFKLINLRPLVGLRSPIDTLVRLLNPLHAKHSIQGIFHPNYGPIHQNTSLLLNQPNMAVLKGEGGETERNPDMSCLVQSIKNHKLTTENWPALFANRHIKTNNMEPEQLVLFWRGKIDNEFAKATVIGTVAVVLKLLNRASTQQQAHKLATDYWLNRDIDSKIYIKP